MLEAAWSWNEPSTDTPQRRTASYICIRESSVASLPLCYASTGEQTAILGGAGMPARGAHSWSTPWLKSMYTVDSVVCLDGNTTGAAHHTRRVQTGSSVDDPEWLGAARVVCPALDPICTVLLRFFLCLS